MLSVLLFGLIALGSAGRAPYLGEDINDLKEQTKRSGVTAQHVTRPVTAQQKDNYNKYNQKFTDIAKAYAEGYKAAIKAVQARAMIAQKRIQATHQVNFPAAIQQQQPVVKSVIPQAPTLDSAAAAVANNGGMFQMPVPNEVTVNGMEKSGIPHPDVSPSPSSLITAATTAVETPITTNEVFHKVVERSAPFYGYETPQVQQQQPEHTMGFANVPLEQMSEKARDEITKLNFAARHRNVYFDHPGGATKQNVLFQKKHKRRRRSLLERHRRSRMPYLGQNLDAMGVVRAQIDWDAKPNKKTDLPEVPKAIIVKEDEKTPSAESNVMKESNTARSEIPQQQQQIQQQPNIYGYTYQFPQQQQRSNVPMNQFQMAAPPLMYPSQYYAGFIPNEVPSTYQPIEDQTAPTVERTKKSIDSDIDYYEEDIY